MTKFWEIMSGVAEKLEEPSVFWLFIAGLIAVVSVRLFSQLLKFMNERLEIKRKWDHHDSKLQEKTAKRLKKEKKRKENLADANLNQTSAGERK